MAGSAFVPSSVTVTPLTDTRPCRMESSAARREATPAPDDSFCSRSTDHILPARCENRQLALSSRVNNAATAQLRSPGTTTSCRRLRPHEPSPRFSPHSACWGPPSPRRRTRGKASSSPSRRTRRRTLRPRRMTKPEIVLGYVGKFLTPKPRRVLSGLRQRLRRRQPDARRRLRVGLRRQEHVRGARALLDQELQAVRRPDQFAGAHERPPDALRDRGLAKRDDAAFYGLGMGTSLANRCGLRSQGDLRTRRRGKLPANDWSVFKGSVGLEAYMNRARAAKDDRRSKGSLTPEQAPGSAPIRPTSTRGPRPESTRARRRATRASAATTARPIHSFTNTNDPYQLQPRRRRSHPAHPDPARDVGRLAPRQVETHPWQRHERHAVLPAALARQRQHACARSRAGASAIGTRC